MATPATCVDPAGRVQASFERQSIMRLLGASLDVVEPGRVDIVLPYRADLCQQNGFLHAGISTTIADSAGGYAAFSLFQPDEDVLTSEFKINFLDVYKRQVWYRGAHWQAELAEGQPAHGGEHIITEMRGTRLVLTPKGDATGATR